MQKNIWENWFRKNQGKCKKNQGKGCLIEEVSILGVHTYIQHPTTSFNKQIENPTVHIHRRRIRKCFALFDFQLYPKALEH